MTEAITLVTGFAHLTDLPCISLRHGNATAVISLYGAQLLSYQPSAGREVLWLSPQASWHNGTAIRGGVPICWPWFGPATKAFNPDNIVVPNHGLVRNRLWQLVSKQVSNNGVSVNLQLELNDLPHYSGTARLLLSVTLNDSLSLSLSCHSQIAQQAALHSYFKVGTIDSAVVRPLPSVYQDKVSNSLVNDAEVALKISTEVDRIYPQSASQLRLDSALGALGINQAGHDATVVWNPWQVKSSKMTDMPAEGYQQFVCVETARLTTNANALSVSQQLKPL
ncbi:D-hexose-6-phosphate mutarotase [Rheinheimera nanhaiensis]|uniref:Putative glucose-6-phosphate 1-epimerase n=1 Tax=Rheinheimera nanhaiensis E407-8 TaxID=562729 RepID=I1DYE7_9GAMM|nr:D-hexose-6-phosphate mutarotase [Rheinheimera nanhaiensis]GAB59075.1 glucose-6-phosphate 1-epimerase [Rheinheimera nanhaiensis E407-8]